MEFCRLVHWLESKATLTMRYEETQSEASRWWRGVDG